MKENTKLGLLKAMLKAAMATSNGDARRTVQQGSVSVDEQKITDFSYAFTKEQIRQGVIVKKGKKVVCYMIEKNGDVEAMVALGKVK